MATTPGFGSDSYIQFGRETAGNYGTVVAATHRLGIISHTVKPTFAATIENPTLNAHLVSDDVYLKGEKAEGTITMVMGYTGMLQLIDGLFGTNTFGSSGGSTSGDGPYVHSFTPKTLLNSYTFEYIDGNIPSTKCQRTPGTKIVGMRWNVVAGEGDNALMQVEIDVKAKEYQVNQTPTAALTAVAQLPVWFDHFNVITDGSGDTTDIIMKSLGISISPKIVERFALGSSTLLEPLRNGKIEVVYDFEREFNTISQITNLKAGSSVALVFRATSGTNYIEFRSDAAKIIDAENPVPGEELLTQTVQARGIYDASTLGFKIIVQNSQATIIT